MSDKSIKDQVMEKKSKGENPVQPLTKIELQHTAFSVAKNPENGKWLVLRIMYDLTSGNVAKPEVISEDIERSIAIERYKIAVAKSGILG